MNGLVGDIDDWDTVDLDLEDMPRSARRLNLRLCDAFELVNTSWLDVSEQCSKHGLDEEEELHELLSSMQLDDEDVAAIHEAELS